ncbi:MAG: hypothetical protein E7500_08435 [Ruminococcus sp.]|nr:hypothetical protein [Ruminococcus sp.]
MKTETQIYEFTCSVCGKKSEHSIIKNSSAPDAPDLDLRPSEPHRSSMEYWVMECPHCGYCNDIIEKPADFSHDYFEGEEYKGCGGIETEEPLAVRFIKKALVNTKNHTMPDAVQAYLYASWVFDDKNDEKNASACRMKAVKIMDENPAVFGNNENFAILKADMLRRSGEFQRVVSEFKDKIFSKPIFTVIAGFEVMLAEKKDSGVYKSTDIPGVSAN